MEPVSITPLLIDQLPVTRKGLTDFTYARYLPPHLCDYEGKSLFIDSDMLLLDDITKLFNLPWSHSVSVVDFTGELTFERPSVMLFNNEKCETLTPEYIDDANTVPQAFEWSESVGKLSKDWNHLVGYSEPNPNAKLIHYTQGIPGYKECRNCEYSDEWFKEYEIMTGSVSWLEIMGHSVHAEPVLSRLQGELC